MDKGQVIRVAFELQKQEAEGAFACRVKKALDEISMHSRRLKQAKQDLLDLKYDEPVMPEL